ncbi:hypothetical protein D3C71_1999810 [compost metagenome]
MVLEALPTLAVTEFVPLTSPVSTACWWEESVGLVLNWALTSLPFSETLRGRSLLTVEGTPMSISALPPVT